MTAQEDLLWRRRERRRDIVIDFINQGQIKATEPLPSGFAKLVKDLSDIIEHDGSAPQSPDEAIQVSS